MGKQHRARRAAKQRLRHQQRSRSGSWRHHEVSAPSPEDLLLAAASAEDAGDRVDRDALVGAVVRACLQGGQAEVGSAIAGLLERRVAAVWDGGWQPNDLAGVARGKLSGRSQKLTIAAIGAQSASYAAIGAEVAPAWMAQLHSLGARPPSPPTTSWPIAWARAHGLAPDDLVRAAVGLLALFQTLPALPELAPPPTAWRRDRSAAPANASAAERKALDRVRALLTKAESTEFPEEAEALTTKAQELMTRHRIERLLAAEPDDDGPEQRRLWIEDPYATPKAMLLGIVAEANGCRALFTSNIGVSTLLGLAADLDAVEVLFTSLLVQATTALHHLGQDDRRARGRSFRQSFHVAYATRIDQRLAEGAAHATEAAEADHGADLLPVLARSDEAVEGAFRAAFPHIVERHCSANDASGWAAGKVAADLADLAPGCAALRKGA